MNYKVFLNNKLVDEKDAKISVFDHGVLYGDGVFEGIRAYNGKIFKLKEHLDRLQFSAKAISLEIPLNNKQLTKAIIETIRANKLKDTYVRVVVTRGVGDLGLDPKKTHFPTIFIIAKEISLYPLKYYQTGLELVTVSIRRNHPEALNPKIKSLNYLNNILAKIEVDKTSACEGLMLTTAGYVAECTGENIFIVKNKILLTPPTYVGVLEGITRQTTMELACKLGFKAKEEILTRYDIYNADECFITGTAAQIMPVVKLDGRIIGNGTPGKITFQLIKEFQKLTKKEGTPVY